MKKVLQRLVSETDGQDLVEYALLAGLIALAVVTLLSGIGSALSTNYSSVSVSVAS